MERLREIFEIYWGWFMDWDYYRYVYPVGLFMVSLLGFIIGRFSKKTAID